MKNIHIVTLGGTIVSVKNDTNTVSATLTGEELVESLPEISQMGNISTSSFLQVGSSELTIDDIISLSSEILSFIDKGMDAIIVTQGTDTIEETSFILDLLIQKEVPIIVTGSMRNPTLRGADGPANLLASVQVATSQITKGIGPVVIFNEDIHAAQFVRKSHTQNISAIQSYPGPIGSIAEGVPFLLTKPERKRPFSFKYKKSGVSVALLSSTIGEDGRILPFIESAGYNGLVVEGLGGGHVSSKMAEQLIDLAQRIPVVLASRTGQGKVLTNTYGGHRGSETNLLKNGLIGAGSLDGRKSRVFLHLLLRSGNSYSDIKHAFSFF